MLIILRNDKGEMLEILPEMLAARLSALELDALPESFEEWCYVVDKALGRKVEW